MSLKNAVTPPGIDPGTIRLVAQRHNHYTTAGPQNSVVIICEQLPTVTFLSYFELWLSLNEFCFSVYSVKAWALQIVILQLPEWNCCQSLFYRSPLSVLCYCLCASQLKRGVKKTNNWYLPWRSKWKTRNKQLCCWQISSAAEVCAVGYAGDVYWVVSIETGSLGEITDWLLPSSLGIDVTRVLFLRSTLNIFFISCHIPLNFTVP